MSTAPKLSSFDRKGITMHIWKHFCTVTRHRHKVIIHCVRAGIGWQGLFHDLSKYTPTEFWIGAKYYQGNRSPNEGEREAYGFSYAWMHHKGRNRHHYEYWTDYDPVSKEVRPVKMPERFVIEMFCDRVAACKIYRGKAYRQGDALSYFQKGRAKYSMHPCTAALLEKMLILLSEQGETATFSWLRGIRKSGASLYSDFTE